MLSYEQTDAIANDECRNAAGGIYARRVHQFARAIEQAARNQALEEAAKVCEEIQTAADWKQDALECVAAIRAPRKPEIKS